MALYNLALMTFNSTLELLSSLDDLVPLHKFEIKSYVCVLNYVTWQRQSRTVLLLPYGGQ